MFIYLSKKIAIPNNTKLKSIAWNSEQGWIACGGENGLLKVLKLEASTGVRANGTVGIAAPSNLSMNQTLDGHNGAVMVVTWNEIYRKLTTSDAYGLIIVWMLHKGMWFEEMINNRNKSVVTSMRWTADGQKICIVYEDGAVIVGSVDGNRLWGKETKLQLSHVEWTPDGRNILFGTSQGDIHVFDASGNFVFRLPLYCIDEDSKGETIVTMDWYDGAEGFVDDNAPTLAIVFANGRAQLMRSVNDDRPVLLDTDMRLSKAEWSSNGQMLAIAGTVQTSSGGELREVSMVQFYNPYGQHIRSLKVPGNGITALSWEGNSLRIAFAVDCYIYFANLRPDYRWGYFSNTLVYAYNKPERPESCVVFRDTVQNETHVKYVNKLLAIRACGENCVLAAKAEEQEGQYILILCNAIGSPVDCKYIDIEPLQITITKYHVIVANNEQVYVWQYRTLVSKLTSVETSSSLRRKEGRERTFHIDDGTQDGNSRQRNINDPIDSICCIAATDKVLMIGRESGAIHRYTLPHISLEHKYVVNCRPQLLALNCESKTMSIIDIHGVLSFFYLDETNEDSSIGKHVPMERKDVWDMRWSDDNPDLIAIMEKTRMYILANREPEEPITSSGYLCDFNNLEIKAALLDEIMADPARPESSHIVTFETKALRDTRDIIEQVNIKEAYAYIERFEHPRLWRLLAEAALERLDFNLADKAFVRCNDFMGIQFVKKMKVLDNKQKQKAEIAAYFKRFDEAETLYREMDRRDLAVDLWARVGNWHRVEQLVQGGAGDDKMHTRAMREIGDHYVDRREWARAVQMYTKIRDNERLVDCFYNLEDYAGLEKLIDALPDGSPQLASIGEKFALVGMSEPAVAAYIKAGDVKSAIDTCVLLNQWDQAVQLAEKYEFQQIEGLLTKYAQHLLDKKKPFQAIELYRKAGRHSDSARLLNQLAKAEAAKKVEPLMVKKLFVLSALEMEKFKNKTIDLRGGNTTMATAMSMTAQTLDGLLDGGEDGADKPMESSWHGAEAYHFFMMAQQQLYENKYDFALRTALFLSNYEDVLDCREIYSIIALAAFFNKCYQQCSKAFIKLEALEDGTPEELEQYGAVAMELFRKHTPTDPNMKRVDCPNDMCANKLSQWDTHCNTCGHDFPICVASGRIILEKRSEQTPTYRCRNCRHYSLQQEIQRQHRSSCPLCHAPIKGKSKPQW